MILLVQARQPGDPMTAHETECIRRRLDAHHERLVVHNALAEPAKAEWLDGARAVLLGGSGQFSVHHRANREWVEPLIRLLDATLSRGVPGFGICFGHQLLGELLGAEVITCERRTEIGTIDVELTEDGARDPLFGGLGARFDVHTGHTDCVTSIPDGAVLLAQSESLLTQAFRVAGAPFWSTQFHPDLTGAEARSRYLAYRDALTSAESAAEAERLAERFTPGADVSTGLLRAFCDHVLGEADRDTEMTSR